MAKKKSNSTKSDSGKRRKRRSAEEIIADLQAEIERVKARAHAKSLKASPAMKAALSSLKNLDKALDLAAEESDTALRHALADARKALGGHLETEGLKLPKANLPKGPRPK